MGTSSVRVVDPDAAIDVVSQIQNDNVEFPCVVVTRSESYSIDSSRMNFTRLHRGVSAVIDPETNNIYDERWIPITLEYNITVLGTNVPDMDELTRELLFKYSHMYFLTIHPPYESNRAVRFGVIVDPSQPVEQSSGVLSYLQSGKLYQNIIHLSTEGCVLLNYVPHKLPRYEREAEIKLN